MRIKTLSSLLIVTTVFIANVSYANPPAVQVNFTNATQYKYHVVPDTVLGQCTLLNATSYKCIAGQALIFEADDATGAYTNIAFNFNKDNSYRIAQAARGAMNPSYQITGSVKGTLPSPGKQYIDGTVKQDMMVNIYVVPANSKSAKKSP